MQFIGIDPGLTGAVAVIYNDGTAMLLDTPTCKIKSGKNEKTDYLPSEMALCLSTMNPVHTHVFLEKVGAMPGQGVTSMFNFGKGFGIWIGILSGLKLPYTLVTPQAWKKMLMQGMPDKDAARIRAQQLFPDASQYLSRKKDIGRADALLIAEYGRRTIGF